MKVWDIITIKDIRNYHRSQRVARARREVNKFFNTLETRGGIVGNHAYLMVYTKECPEKSYILVDKV